MIKFLVMPLVVMLSCGSTKTKQSETKVDPAVVSEKPVKNEEAGDLYQRDSVIETEPVNAAVPKCIKNKIDSFRLKEPHERPQSVKEYTYKGRKVYYVVMPCCDFFNEVYDANCNYLGAPDGGITGKGDGKLPDFATEAKAEKTIWKAPK